MLAHERATEAVSTRHRCGVEPSHVEEEAQPEAARQAAMIHSSRIASPIRAREVDNTVSPNTATLA